MNWTANGTRLFAAAMILGYFAWIYADCMRDRACHVVYCGNRPCGFSHNP